jgi:protein gp37
MGLKNYRNGFKLTCHPESLQLPLRWKKPKVIFVNSMSDMFHEDVPMEFIQDVFNIMRQANHHLFQILTKRAERLAQLSPNLNWPKNVWVGVTVEAPNYNNRINYLRTTGACVKFLSLEPLLGDLGELPLFDIDWVIVGGESGPGARPMNIDWIRSIRDQCYEQQVPFFFKQWGGVNKKKAGRVLDSRTWNQMPKNINPEGEIYACTTAS